MPSPLTIIRQRRHRRDRSRRSAESRTGRVVFVVGFVLSALLVLGLVAGALAYADLTRGLPPVREMTVLLNPADGLLLQPTRLYDRTGTRLLAVIAPTDSARTYIPYDQIPQSLINATLVLADPNFWQHGGYVMDGWRDPASHPTLAQRLASDLLLWDEPLSPRRALRERLLAAQLTAEFGREKIIEWYLNSADYGNDAYGAEAAAQLYFGKSVTQLDLGESALLAAVSQAPALNPFDAPEAAEELRLQALQAMLDQGLISPADAAQAAAERPSLLPPSPIFGRGAGGEGFVNLALDQLGQRFDPQRVRRGGLTVVTTLDYDLQLQADCAVKNYLAGLAGETDPLPAADGSDCEAARLLPSLPAGTSLPDASASVIVTDPRSGQVLAAVGDVRGGQAPEVRGQAGAYLQSHPAGTLLTPFLYLTGFTRGLSPATLGWDIPGGLANFDGQYRGPLRLRTALVNDYLPPAGAVLDQMGAESVGRIAAPFGLTIPPGADILRDDISVSPLDAAAAYGVFANQGTLAGQALSGEAIRPATVLKVTGVDGALWADWTTPRVQAVVSPQLAYLMTDVLADASARWPTLGQSNPLTLDRPAAAKAARSLDLSAAWTAGYTPQRVTVAYVGAGAETDSVSPLLAADLWHAVMAYAVRNLPAENWTVPAGVTTVLVCDPSGLLPTDACPNVVGEVFLAGNEPVQADTLYQSFEVDIETGLLATVFTPPELIQARTYMVVPPEARTWAEAAGIPVPPAEYDAIQTPVILPDVHITAPLLFAQVGGTVEIRGSASGADFASYRLEFGQGLNPQAWTQIGTDSATAVTEGALGSWDTSGLEGLYALRLLVVRTDRRVEQAVVVVTITQP
ncbi:MAG: glycosyl transferase family protein [Anaerolineaceae bacterium]|nr:MAG: glycosyl transferase family protein [Anaerolineaceae bacterium]